MFLKLPKFGWAYCEQDMSADILHELLSMVDSGVLYCVDDLRYYIEPATISTPLHTWPPADGTIPGYVSVSRQHHTNISLLKQYETVVVGGIYGIITLSAPRGNLDLSHTST